MEKDGPGADFYQNLHAGDGASLESALFDQHMSQFLENFDALLSIIYQQKLVISTERQAPIIDLNSIPPSEVSTRIKQLDAKLVEYTVRLKDQVFISPINLYSLLDALYQLDTLYKREALMLLLQFGKLNTWAYSRALAVTLNTLKFGAEAAEELGHTPIPKSIFDNACAVIENYVRNAGRDTEGGTGLPQIG